MKTTIREILEKRGPDVWSIQPSSSVYDAIEMMDGKSVGALAVTSENKLVGIISERDYARKVILQGKSSKVTTVGEVMSSDVVSVNEDHTVQQCMTLMTQERVRHLPVINGEELTAMISLGDMVARIVEEQKVTIGQLKSYTQGMLIIGATIAMSIMLQASYG